MAKNLLIVESPAKAKTIEKFLGGDFKVVSSYGHIRDLGKGDKAIDVENKFNPVYEVPADKKELVKNLKKLAKAAEDVWLATDEDREGEAISWHLCEILGLDPKVTKRIVFHEITKGAIQKAVDNPRKVNLDVVNAQQARRILDRLVGFELSPILWRKISLKNSLSAGRVQSVAVRLIVEREREIMAFNSESSFKVTAEFFVENAQGKKVVLAAESLKRFGTEAEAQAFLEDCNKSTFTIKDIQTRPGKRTPAAPFITSTLQQEASRKLGFSVSRTMSVAQRLYEAGHITYMRTDSVNLSDTALGAASREITKSFGNEYSHTRKYKSKNSSAQEAHEAIRPTYFENHSITGSAEEERLYDLIWKRTLASQMSDARLEKTTVKIDVSESDTELTAKGEVLLFDGFLKLYIESTDDEDDEDAAGILPPLSEGQNLEMKMITARERFSKHPPRYNEASLVRKLEELGIGRPSTYAPTISTIQKRQYAEKREREGTPRAYRELTLSNGNIKQETLSENTGVEKGKLFPTDAGSLVTDFLKEHFPKVMDYHFTAKIEEEFDDIADGKLVWNSMIGNFYKPFHETVEKTLEEAEYVTGERELGVDPKSGRKLIVRMGKYGPMAQIGGPDEEEKPRYAKLRPDQTIETINAEEAMELFKLPRELGEYEEKMVKANIGRFGPYVQLGSLFASITKASELDPYEITFDQAVELIVAKKKADAEKFIMAFEEEDIQVLNGGWGPYIKVGKKNVKIPKDVDAKKLTLAECQDLIKNDTGKKKKPVRKAKK